MTHIQIPDIPPRIQYTADGVETIFTYPFPIFASADLSVYLGSTLQVAGYTVAGVGVTAGGTVTFTTPPTDQVIVTLVRDVPTERLTDFQVSGTFRANTINDELDTIYAIMQQIEELQSRSLTLSETASTSISLELPDPSSRRALVWNTAAEGLENTVYDPDTALALATQASDDAAAAATSASAAQTAAEAAAAAAAAAGSVSLLYSGVTLVDGVDEYLLPMQVPSRTNVEINIEGARLSPDGSTYEITDTLGVSQTLKLLGGVATTPTGLEWAAGMQMDMITRVGGVSSADINNGSVTTVKLSDDAVTSAKMADDAVTSAKILADAVTTVKVVDGAVTTAKINAKAVTLAKMADGTPGKWLKFNDSTGEAEETDLPAISKGVTADFAWVNGGTVTESHAAGSRPESVSVEVECLVAENGYVPGDVLSVAPFVNFTNTSSDNSGWNYTTGFTLTSDAANFRFIVAPGGISVLDTSGNGRVLTASNWRARVLWRIY